MFDDDTMAVHLLICKRTRQLTVQLEDGRSVVLPCGLGRGVGAKVERDDLRTPEGCFHICTRNPRSRFHRSLGLSYPLPADARRGLDHELIDRSQYEAILAAHARGARPPWDTALGGEIMIHGGLAAGETTRGCISLFDDHVQWLYRRVPLGCPVTIRGENHPPCEWETRTEVLQ